MELSEQVTALTAQNKQLTEGLNNVNAEKIALDKMFVESLQGSLSIRKQLLLKEAEVNQLNVMISSLNKEKEVYLAEIDQHVKKINELKLELDRFKEKDMAILDCELIEA
jgi:chromosome segregation ATPase